MSEHRYFVRGSVILDAAFGGVAYDGLVREFSRDELEALVWLLNHGEHATEWGALRALVAARVDGQALQRRQARANFGAPLPSPEERPWHGTGACALAGCPAEDDTHGRGYTWDGGPVGFCGARHSALWANPGRATTEERAALGPDFAAYLERDARVYGPRRQEEAAEDQAKLAEALAEALTAEVGS